MQEIYIKDLGIILKNKKTLEKELKVKISNKGKVIFINGTPLKEFTAIKVLEAINLGFSINKALYLRDEEIMLQVLNIKDITKRNDLDRVRGRLIGTHGKTIENLSNLSDCYISVRDNQVGIIGEINTIEETKISLTRLILGSKQGNIYSRLERKKKERRQKPKETIKNELK